MSDRDPLDDDLNRLRWRMRWALLSPEEADAELAAAPEQPLDPGQIDTLIGSVLAGEVQPSSLEPPEQSQTEESLEADRHALLFNHHPDGDEGHIDEPPLESRREAEEEGENDPDDGLRPTGPQG